MAFHCKKNHKRPAISCHLPGKNQMQGNKRVMGNFNLNKWAQLCCALALNLGSELTHSRVPQYISRPSSCWIQWNKNPLIPWGVRATLLSCHGASMPVSVLICPYLVQSSRWLHLKPQVFEGQNLSPPTCRLWKTFASLLSQDFEWLNFQTYFKRSTCAPQIQGRWVGSSVPQCEGNL